MINIALLATSCIFLVVAAIVIIGIVTITEAIEAAKARANAKANARSFELLNEWLTPEQRECFAKEGGFVVTGSQGRLYAISKNGVSELDCNGRRRTKWCFRPADNVPIGDVMLAQKIALETDEDAAILIANPMGR